jgi:uncharacterized phage protein (TIGR01671 family)
MSRFKFRAWDKWERRMIQPNKGDFIGWHSMSNWKSCLAVMQWTGIKDFEGVEIYEGDIVKIDRCNQAGYTETGVIGKVEYQDFEWIVVTEDSNWPVNSWLCVVRAEVIGNIYENEQLLND